MADNLSRTLARRLVEAGALTIGEAARAAGTQRASVAYWTRDLDAPAARLAYFSNAWARARASLSALPDRALAELAIARGAGTPVEVASILNLNVQVVYRWIADLDHKAARIAFCQNLWTEQMTALAASVERSNAEYKRRWALHQAGDKSIHWMPDGSLLFAHEMTEAQKSEYSRYWGIEITKS